MGILFHDSWHECSECCDEHDEREAREAAVDSLAEQRKQTAILEQMAQQKHPVSVGGQAINQSGRVVTCPNGNCSKLMSWQLEQAGKKVNCPHCKSSLLLPSLVK